MSRSLRQQLNEAIRKIAVYHNIGDKNNVYRAMTFDADFDNAAAQQSEKANEDAKKATQDISFDSILDDLVQFSDSCKVMHPYDLAPGPAGAKKSEDGILKEFANNLPQAPDFIKSSIRFFGNFQNRAPGEFTKLKDFMLGEQDENIRTMIYGNSTEGINADAIDGKGTFGPDSPCISMTEMRGKWLSRNVTDTSAVSLFCNGIPSIELSQAVPYFDMKLINTAEQAFVLKGKKVHPNQTVSVYNFLHGTGELDTVGGLAIQATSEDAPPVKKQGDDGTEQVIKPSMAGMELFTMPQSFTPNHKQYVDLNPDGLGGDTTRTNAILDTFRPLMTVKSFKYVLDMGNIAVPTIRGSIDIILHDRSRLQEIAPLIRPDKFQGAQEILIEFGWSHPGDSPYALLLNSCRLKRKFTVISSNYSFETNGTVNITIELISKGGDTMIEGLPCAADGADGVVDPFNALQQALSKLAAAIRKLDPDSRTTSLSDILGKSAIPAGKFSNPGAMLTLSAAELTKIKAEIKKLEDNITTVPEITDEHISKCQAILDAMDTATGQTQEYRTQVNKYWTKIEGFIKDTAATDPFANDWATVLKKQSAIGGAFSKKTHISLGRLIGILTIPPLLHQKEFDAIDFQFYRCNPDSYGFSLFPSIAALPVQRTDFIKFLKVFREAYPNPPMLMTLMCVFDFLNSYKGGDSGWGIGGALTAVVKDGKVTTAYRNSKTDYYTKLDKAATLYYGGPRTLVNPKFRVEPESYPVYKDDTKTILKLHIYDATDNSHTTVTDLIKAAKSTAVGIVKQKSNEDAEWLDPAQAKVFEKLVKAGALKKVEIKNAYKTAKNKELMTSVKAYKLAFNDPMQLRYFISQTMPTIKFGTEYTILKTAQVTSAMDDAYAKLALARQQKNSDRPAGTEAGDAVPFEVFPTTLSLSTVGCTLFRHSQQFFFDYQSNTNLDNVYQVSQLEHTIEPGRFETTVTAKTVGQYGTYESLGSKLTEAQASLEAAVNKSK